MSTKHQNFKSLLNINTLHRFQVNIIIKTVLITLFIPGSALAYVGPGAGITALGALWAVILAILFAVGGFLAWPIRAMLRRKKRSAQSKSTDSGESDKKINE